ncbi:hypothetical protein A7985_11325 [Pseudoalteromonas luteoviolacea]|uniref:Lipoprotein n=1 Tax=Pseudoalteromonas luteoviolacea TaxID=43657 RepID=A0A1C0TQZ0_9GAMM|nr:hypothetical protein [Pseudoalteromonas luteoviolacea]OCQ21213.1 hypothetical protein A7985_11325 [Pseudoalteromonas luteoviolacea]
MKRIYINVFLVTLLCVFMVGCQSTIHSTRINDNKPLQAGQGVVALELVNNTDRLASLHKNWDEVIVIRIDNEEQRKQAAIQKAKEKAKKNGKKFDPEKVDWEHDYYSLRANSKGTVDSQVFVGAMPEGEYIISLLYSFYSDGNMSSWINMPVFQSAGVFQVKNAQLTNLGTLVFQPLLDTKKASFWSNKTEQRAYVTRLEESTALAPFVNHHYQNLYNSLDLSQVNSWKDDPFSKLRNQLGALSRANAYGDEAISVRGSDYNVLAARFGKLHLVDSAGNVETQSLPTASQLTASGQINDTLLIGSERGVLFSQSQDGSWLQHQPISATEAFVWLGSDDRFGYALTSSEKQHSLYRFVELDKGWQKIGSFKKKDGHNWLVQNGGLFVFFDDAGELKVINDNKLLTYNEASGQWKSAKYESFKKFSQLKTGELVALEVSQWDGIGDQVVSVDYGKSWHTIDRSLSFFGDHKTDASLPALISGNRIVSVGRVKENKKKGKKKLRVISASLNKQGKKFNWQSHGEVKSNCTTLLPELTQGAVLFFLCEQGQVVKTDDFGESWESVVVIDIALMQQQYEAFLDARKAELALTDQKETSTQ